MPLMAMMTTGNKFPTIPTPQYNSSSNRGRGRNGHGRGRGGGGRGGNGRGGSSNNNNSLIIVTNLRGLTVKFVEKLAMLLLIATIV
jgi:hypothetical protein